MWWAMMIQAILESAQSHASIHSQYTSINYDFEPWESAKSKSPNVAEDRMGLRMRQSLSGSESSTIDPMTVAMIGKQAANVGSGVAAAASSFTDDPKKTTATTSTGPYGRGQTIGLDPARAQRNITNEQQFLNSLSKPKGQRAPDDMINEYEMIKYLESVMNGESSNTYYPKYAEDTNAQTWKNQIWETE